MIAPSKLPYSFHPAATEEFAAGQDWYANHNTAAGERFLQQISSIIDCVRQLPASGAPYLHRTRRVLLRSLPYGVVYRVRRNVIEIIVIAHTSRRPGYWRERLDE